VAYSISLTILGTHLSRQEEEEEIVINEIDPLSRAKKCCTTLKYFNAPT
jgi:hypothetical protein